MDVVKEEYATFAAAKKILEEAAKTKELGYEQNNALEYLKKFAKLSDKKAAELMEDLGSVAKLKERHKVLIADFLPEDADDLRVLFAHELISLNDDEKKAVLAAVKKVL
ncbi:MAG: DNA-directed RNA polymerase subunit F [Candidatus Aenigmarchaeota archaeon]|nr:DNA-directed RNA polymerase subunit F [Candidatus Aenigmarchaeota archaeon]